MKTAVLLNDTSYENHHGCSIVVKNIQQNLERRGIALIATNPIGKNWKENGAFLEALKRCDVVLVNGEGTIHHNSPYGLSLLQVVEHTDKPTVLMNMTYQENAPHFAELAAKFSRVYVRESFSRDELNTHNVASTVVPDMTFGSDHAIAAQRNGDVVVSDSHDIRMSETLFDLAAKQHLRFIPVLAPYEKYTSFKGRIKKFKYRLAGWLGSVLPLKYAYRRYAFVQDEARYLDTIGHCGFLLTARYHAMCIALQTMTPFVVMRSNTYKIEGLLHDMGLSQKRLFSLNDLSGEALETMLRQWGRFSPEEYAQIERFNADAKARIAAMFDEIAALAEHS